MAQNKSFYHSEVESMTNGDAGGAWMTFEKEPTDRTKNKDLAGFATVTDWNGTPGRYFNIENANVLAALRRVPVGQPVFVKAGGKGPAAWVNVLDQHGNQLATSEGMAPAPQNAPPQQGPPSGPPQGAPPSAPPAQQSAPPAQHHNTNGSTGRPLSRTYWDAFVTAAAMLKAAQTDEATAWLLEGTTADGRLHTAHAIAASLNIEFHKKGGSVPISRDG